MKKLKLLGAATFCLLALNIGSARAQTESVALPAQDYFKIETPAPDIGKIPFIETMTKNGATFHYMGSRSGLHGFLIVKEGQIQIIYVTPDKKSVLMGGLFAEDGQIVTPTQITALSEKNKEVAAIMEGTAQQNIDVIRAGVAKGGMAEIPSDPAAQKAAQAEMTELPLLVTSPGERLVMDLRASSGVVLGNTSAPELLVVVSLNCSHCKKTWEGLSSAVKEGKLQVRLIPIARDPASDETRLAAQLLRSKEPLKAWESHLSGDKKALEGEPDKEAYRAVVANREMTDRWNIIGTPYLVYRAKDKTIKIVQGKPERMAAVLLDLVQ